VVHDYLGSYVQGRLKELDIEVADHDGLGSPCFKSVFLPSAIISSCKGSNDTNGSPHNIIIIVPRFINMPVPFLVWSIAEEMRRVLVAEGLQGGSWMEQKIAIFMSHKCPRLVSVLTTTHERGVEVGKYWRGSCNCVLPWLCPLLIWWWFGPTSSRREIYQAAWAYLCTFHEYSNVNVTLVVFLLLLLLIVVGLIIYHTVV